MPNYGLHLYRWLVFKLKLALQSLQSLQPRSVGPNHVENKVHQLLCGGDAIALRLRI
jgi:hypothetical protein